MKYELKAKKLPFSATTFKPVYGLFDISTMKKVKYQKTGTNCKNFYRHCIKISTPNKNSFTFYKFCNLEKLNKKDVVKSIINYIKMRECYFLDTGFDKDSLDWFVNKYSK